MKPVDKGQAHLESVMDGSSTWHTWGARAEKIQKANAEAASGRMLMVEGGPDQETD